MGSTTSRRLSNNRAALAERKKRRKNTTPVSDIIVFAKEAFTHDNHERGYSDIYDSRYCLTCNVWIESGCQDPNCCYCGKRPATPRDAEIAGTLKTEDDD